MLDCNALIGPYPFRYVPHPDPEVLVRVLEREGLSGAWVGHLPSAFYRDPAPGNTALFTALASYGDMLQAAPAIRPDWPDWRAALEEAAERGAPAVRAYPPQWGLGPNDPNMLALARACGELGLVLLLTVRFEDLRQRHALDNAGDLTAAAIRAVARVSTATRIVVTAAGREMIEEVHWGLTPDEQSRLYWDISWVWGPPEDHLAKLLRSLGASRFVYGTQWPLRLAQTPRSNLELLPNDVASASLTDVRSIARDARSAAAAVSSRA
jgi:predicted TIM-barrel fold metal-dependent hydrolase